MTNTGTAAHATYTRATVVDGAPGMVTWCLCGGRVVTASVDVAQTFVEAHRAS